MKSWRGIPVSDGVAIGPAFLWRPAEPVIDRTPVAGDQIEHELVRLEAALAAARQQLADLPARATGAGRAGAAILEAQRLMLEDPELLALAQAMVREAGLPAAAALYDAAESYAAQLEGLDDEYLRARAADVRDAARRAVRLLTTGGAAALVLPAPAIIVAGDLAPSETAALDRSLVLGLCTAGGGPTSHTAILARAQGVPAVVGLGPAILDEIAAGATVIVDGAAGTLTAAPDEATIAAAAARRAAWQRQRRPAAAAATEPAVTRDGRRVEVVANLSDAAAAGAALALGAEGVGLLRTEFLFLDRAVLPDEDEQYRAYRAVVAVMGRRPVVIRTLDAGGDKPPRYLEIGPEANPFLGWRAIRICLDRPDLFAIQLRAILRAGLGHNVKVMFPMIASVEEARAARQLVAEAWAAVRPPGAAAPPEVGIMVEVPSAAVIADLLAPEVDFFSIGTNDLTQYTLAVDRGNARVARLYDALHPAVLRLIKGVIDAGHAAGKWVGLCGEMAGDPDAIPLLLGFGLDEFSMNPAAIPAAKALIRRLDAGAMQAVAAQALRTATPAEIRALVRRAVGHAAPDGASRA
jgi:phosphoenolpyruvate-protein phosphotransferase